ncbi:HAUS augmin-like complex subunit 8 isoform X2 [Tyto alba]|uniref:HAUS augmin-like complex subunit 8 isoform X2 n=1 Tax=Tyto alba TaxID=56313 RepID=UPI001403670C|nr:HAUS augmin-like complex subunit 8 isoform X2 [Tyto alba]
MAEAAGMSAFPGGSNTTVVGGEVPKNKLKGGRIVKSRYLQYDTKDTKKDTPTNSFSTSPSRPSFSTKPRSVHPQKHDISAGVDSSLFSESSFEKDDLQSTLLDEDELIQPQLDISAISDKTVHEKSPSSQSDGKEDTETYEDLEEVEDDSDPLISELESRTLLLTYLRVKAGKNLAELEKKAEKNLLMLCEEKERQQEKLCELKREIFFKEREQILDDALDKQMEVLSPLVPVCEQFKDQYKSFAASLDTTRHELPIKNIHIEGDTLTYLGELQKQLTVTKELLTEVMPSYSEESEKTFNVLKDLKEVSQKLDKELQRYLQQPGASQKCRTCHFRLVKKFLCITKEYVKRTMD